jgi:hypothetical protein
MMPKCNQWGYKDKGVFKWRSNLYYVILKFHFPIPPIRLFRAFLSIRNKRDNFVNCTKLSQPILPTWFEPVERNGFIGWFRCRLMLWSYIHIVALRILLPKLVPVPEHPHLVRYDAVATALREAVAYHVYSIYIIPFIDDIAVDRFF